MLFLSLENVNGLAKGLQDVAIGCRFVLPMYAFIFSSLAAQSLFL